MVGRGDVSRAGELLEGALGRSAGSLGVAQRPGTTGGAEFQRSDALLWSFWGAVQRVSRAGPPRGSDIIHGALVGIPDVVGPLQRTGGHRAGLAHCRATTARAGKFDR